MSSIVATVALMAILVFGLVVLLTLMVCCNDSKDAAAAQSLFEAHVRELQRQETPPPRYNEPVSQA